jgi:hypothetical protein
MQEQYLFDPLPDDKIDKLTPEEMKIILRGERDLIRQYKNYINELESELFKPSRRAFFWKNIRFKSNTVCSVKVLKSQIKKRLLIK